MRLLTLIAGYAAGLAVAMKYRKDTGTSKLKTDANVSKIDAFIDEVVDIHKTAYSDVKDFVIANFDDVKTFDDLKSKVNHAIETFTEEAEDRVASLIESGTTQKEEIEGEIDAIFAKKNAFIEEAKEKGFTFADVATDKLLGWIEELKLQLQGARNKLDTYMESSLSKKPAPKKKPSTAKSPKA